MKRALNVKQLLKKKFNEMSFHGKWQDSFGVPERSGAWLIWGQSGNGKTSFTLQLCKYLSQFGKVMYDSLEEGARKSFQEALIRNDMQELGSNFLILDREPVEDLKERLRRHKSPHIIVIDSFQYAGLTKTDYKHLKDEFQSKLFIFISHAEGKHPEGRAAKFVRYDADVKIHIEGYKAFPTSRYGGGAPYIVWKDGAERYWSTN